MINNNRPPQVRHSHHTRKHLLRMEIQQLAVVMELVMAAFRQLDLGVSNEYLVVDCCAQSLYCSQSHCYPSKQRAVKKALDEEGRSPLKFGFLVLAPLDNDDAVVPDQLKFYAENRMHVMRLRAMVVYFLYMYKTKSVHT